MPDKSPVFSAALGETHLKVVKNQTLFHVHAPNNVGTKDAAGKHVFSPICLGLSLHIHNKRIKTIQKATVTCYSSEGLILGFYSIECFSSSATLADEQNSSLHTSPFPQSLLTLRNCFVP